MWRSLLLMLKTSMPCIRDGLRLQEAKRQGCHRYLHNQLSYKQQPAEVQHCLAQALRTPSPYPSPRFCRRGTSRMSSRHPSFLPRKFTSQFIQVMIQHERISVFICRSPLSQESVNQTAHAYRSIAAPIIYICHPYLPVCRFVAC